MTGYRCRMLALAVVLGLLGLTTGCASSPDSMGDPFEPINRGFHAINDGLDDIIVRPIAERYVEYTPEGMREGVSNFFDNATYPNVILNDFLQGKFKQGLMDIGRFLVNSTVGFGGLFDIASGMGWIEHDEDLGQTLGYYGFGEMAYLELPLIGPSSIRDVPNVPVSTYTNLLFYIGESAVTFPLGILRAIDNRSQYLEATRLRDESALDTYIFTREAFRQRRMYLIYDGDPPLEEFDDTEY
jgi:phospholipid-binding lipoprotein MlaA